MNSCNRWSMVHGSCLFIVRNSKARIELADVLEVDQDTITEIGEKIKTAKHLVFSDLREVGRGSRPMRLNGHGSTTRCQQRKQ